MILIGETKLGAKKRIEIDSLGSIEVPASAYYGAQTQRAVENYPISGHKAHAELIDSFLWIKWAAAKANSELGLLSKKIANAIVKASEIILDGKHRDQFVIDIYQAGAGTSLHMNVNETLSGIATEILGGKKGDRSMIHPNDHVNMAQSTNDVMPTAIKLSAMKLIPDLITALTKMEKSLRKKGKLFRVLCS